MKNIRRIVDFVETSIKREMTRFKRARLGEKLLFVGGSYIVLLGIQTIWWGKKTLLMLVQIEENIPYFGMLAGGPFSLILGFFWLIAGYGSLAKRPWSLGLGPAVSLLGLVAGTMTIDTAAFPFIVGYELSGELIAVSILYGLNGALTIVYSTATIFLLLRPKDFKSAGSRLLNEVKY